jgi:hypothetical protein
MSSNRAAQQHVVRCGNQIYCSARCAKVINPVPPIHYSVQYGERDLDYLLRRLEFDGLFWWFSHEKGGTVYVSPIIPTAGWNRPRRRRTRRGVRLAQAAPIATISASGQSA